MINILLPDATITDPIDAFGNALHDGDRVFCLDWLDNVLQRVYGTLARSNEPETLGLWCVNYDDGESFIVLSFDQIYKA